MEIVQVVGICIIATIMILVIKGQRPEIAMQISIVTGIIILFAVSSRISLIIDLLSKLSGKMNIDSVFFATILKIIGIAYTAEFGAEVCKDAGESAIASKIELGGKIFIMVLAIPIISSLVELLIKIVP